jgi:hypothetical protein
LSKVTEKTSTIAEAFHHWGNQHLSALPAKQANQVTQAVEENKLLRKQIIHL